MCVTYIIVAEADKCAFSMGHHSYSYTYGTQQADQTQSSTL